MSFIQAIYHPPAVTIPIHTSSYPFISPEKYQNALEGQVVLITGAGRGIGRVAALAFAAAGANISCLSRTQSDLDTLTQEIKENHKRTAIALTGDVTDSSFAVRAVKETETALGPIDILINNAGIARVSDLEHEKDVTKAWKTVEVSMLGTMSFSQAAIPSMIARKKGTIINVVSILGKVALPFFSAYCAAKAGIIQYTKIIDMELRPKGIYVYAVHPCVSKDTTLAVGAINQDTFENVESFRIFMEEFFENCTDTIDLAANTFVAVCGRRGEEAEW